LRFPFLIYHFFFSFLFFPSSFSQLCPPGTPSIIWLPELNLTYEMPLNAMFHCNAKTDLKGGVFIYDPPVGTILSASV
jgi:hypothetical protein